MTWHLTKVIYFDGFFILVLESTTGVFYPKYFFSISYGYELNELNFLFRN